MKFNPIEVVATGYALSASIKHDETAICNPLFNKLKYKQDIGYRIMPGATTSISVSLSAGREGNTGNIKYYK